MIKYARVSASGSYHTAFDWSDWYTPQPHYTFRLPNIPYLFANADAGVRFHDLIWRNSVLTFDYNLNYIHSYYLSFPGLGAKSSKKVIPEQFSHDLACS